MEPEVLILDEPTAGLDPQGVSALLELLASLRDGLGMTILMATHDMDVVPLCCDYAYLLGGGSVLAQGTPEELFTKAELLRANHLRLPRIAHLMAILRDRDGLDVTPVGTIGAARRELLRLLKQEELCETRHSVRRRGGPGDPELITFKAWRYLCQCPVLAVPQDQAGRKTADGILRAAASLQPGLDLDAKETVALDFPMTRDAAVLAAAHEEAAKTLAAILDSGRDVALITLGCPTIYASCMYVEENRRLRLCDGNRRRCNELLCRRRQIRPVPV